jgi:hypothetical protein
MLTAVYFRTAMAAAPTASRWGLIDAYIYVTSGLLPEDHSIL